MRHEPENVVVFVVIDEKHVQGKIRKGQVPIPSFTCKHLLALFDMDKTSTAGIELERQICNSCNFDDVILNNQRAEY